jgi:hypothetical protein
MPLHDQTAIKDAAVQVRSYQTKNALIRDALTQAFNQDVVVDTVEELLQIHVHHDPAPRLHIRLSGKHRIMRTASRPKTVAMLAETRIEQRLQHLQQGLLDQTVGHRWYTQLALASVRLGNHHPPYRTGPVQP